MREEERAGCCDFVGSEFRVAWAPCCFYSSRLYRPLQVESRLPPRPGAVRALPGDSTQFRKIAAPCRWRTMLRLAAVARRLVGPVSIGSSPLAAAHRPAALDHFVWPLTLVVAAPLLCTGHFDTALRPG